MDLIETIAIAVVIAAVMAVLVIIVKALNRGLFDWAMWGRDPQALEDRAQHLLDLARKGREVQYWASMLLLLQSELLKLRSPVLETPVEGSHTVSYIMFLLWGRAGLSGDPAVAGDCQIRLLPEARKGLAEKLRTIENAAPNGRIEAALQHLEALLESDWV